MSLGKNWASRWLALAGVGLLLAGFLGAGTALAQPFQTGPLPPAGIGGAQGSAESQLLLRLDQLESQVRSLTGQVEEYQHRIDQLEGRLQRFQEDTEYRFQQPGAAPPPGPVASGAEPRGGAPLNLPSAEGAGPRFATPPVASRETESQQQPGYGGLRPLGAPDRQFPPASGGPLDISPGARGGSGDPLAAQPAGPGPGPGPGLGSSSGLGAGSSAQAALGNVNDAQGAYDVAYAFILQRDYQSAGEAFSEFLQRYPGDKLAGNAQYWLGESHYARGQYREAADAFLNGYTKYKGGGKAPDSLLKLGMSLQALGQKPAACASFAEFGKQFPDASGTMKNRIRAEQKGAGC
ncbi:MAG TPA: tol-pal system protein YbgF [Hyphomicrobiales bacterium]|nr:tol-pal system protein YbgF [Rhodobiaceae bacterium]HXK54082.1 tol-pal system protein YbgF [Hyphomicrobiales bacterium]